MASIRRDQRSGNYHVLYRDVNKRQRTKGGFKTKRQAQIWATQIEARMQRGEVVDPQRGRIAFGPFAEDWLVNQHQLKPKTRNDYGHIVRGRLLPALATVPMAKIDRQRVQCLINEQAERYAPGSVKKTHMVLRQILAAAVDEDVLIKNPAERINLPRAGRRQMLFLNAQQVEALANAVPPRYGALVRFAAWTGLRAGEIVALRVSDFTEGLEAVRVTRSVANIGGQLIEGTTKTDRSRTVGIPVSLRDDLRALPAFASPTGSADALVFPGERGGLMNHANFYRRHFKPAVRRALPEELHGLRFHDLRHTAAALLIELGAHPKEIADRLGHSSITVTMDRYGHVMPARDQALTAALDTALRAAR